MTTIVDIRRQNVKYSLLLPFPLCLDFPSEFITSAFPTKTSIVFLFYFPSTCYMPCPFHPFWFYHQITIERGVPITNPFRMHFSPVSFHEKGPCTPVRLLFTKTLGLCSFADMRDQVSNPSKIKSTLSCVMCAMHSIQYVTKCHGGC